MSVEWRAVPGYEGLYEVSEDGQVRSLPRTVSRRRWPPAQLRGYLMAINRCGRYPMVKLCRDGVGRQWRVHALVTASFLGPRPAGLEVRHLNGDAQDNRVANLAYGTSRENSADMAEHGHNWQANKTHCPHGHTLRPVSYFPDGRRRPRRCMECERARSRRRSAARRAGVAA